MKLVIAIEGMDGAGKSSLATFLEKLCLKFGCPLQQIGRRESRSTPLVGKMTRLLHSQAHELTPHADVFVRIAREYQRVKLAAAAPSGIVVLDRFVLSVLSLARIGGLEVDPVTRILKDLVARASLHATVFVKCAFEVAWCRVKERNDSLEPRGKSDEDFLRRKAEIMEQDFHAGILTGERWLVDNSDELEDAERQLAAYLLPHLRGK